MSELQLEKLAQGLCTIGGNCLSCNAAIGFECTHKQTAKKVIELGWYTPIEGTWVSNPNEPEIAVARTRFGQETYSRNYCSVCGARSRDTGNFCSHCGARLRRL